MSQLGVAFVELRGDDKHLEKNLNAAEKKVKTASDKMSAHLKKAFKVGFAAAGVAALATGAILRKIVKDTAATGDAFDKMSLRTGVAVEKLSALGYAASISGSNIETIEKSLRYVSKIMVDFSNDTGTAKDTLNALGLTVTDTNGRMKDTADFMLEVADKIRMMKDETKKAAYVSEIFGARAGTQLLPMLKLGSAGIEDLMEKAKELGVVMSTEDATKAAEFTDALTDLEGALEGVKRTIGIALLPDLTELANKMANWVVANKEFIKIKINEYLNNVASSLKSIAGFLQKISEFKDKCDWLFKAAGFRSAISQGDIDRAQKLLGIVKDVNKGVAVFRGKIHRPAEIEGAIDKMGKATKTAIVLTGKLTDAQKKAVTAAKKLLSGFSDKYQRFVLGNYKYQVKKLQDYGEQVKAALKLEHKDREEYAQKELALKAWLNAEIAKLEKPETTSQGGTISILIKGAQDWLAAVQGSGEDWKKYVTQASKKSAGITENTAKKIAGLSSKLTSGIAGNIAGAANLALEIGRLIKGVIELLKEIVKLPVDITNMVADLFNTIGDFGKNMTAAIDNLIDSVYNMIVGIGDIVEKLIPKLLKAVPQMIDGIMRAIPKLITAVIDSIPKIINAFVSYIPNIIAAFVKGIPNIAVTAVKSVVSLPGDLFGMVKKGISDLWDGIGDLWGGISNAFSSVKKFVGFGGGKKWQYVKQASQVSSGEEDLFKQTESYSKNRRVGNEKETMQVVQKVTDTVLDVYRQLYDRMGEDQQEYIRKNMPTFLTGTYVRTHGNVQKAFEKQLLKIPSQVDAALAPVFGMALEQYAATLQERAAAIGLSVPEMATKTISTSQTGNDGTQIRRYMRNVEIPDLGKFTSEMQILIEKLNTFDEITASLNLMFDPLTEFQQKTLDIRNTINKGVEQLRALGVSERVIIELRNKEAAAIQRLIEETKKQLLAESKGIITEHTTSPYQQQITEVAAWRDAQIEAWDEMRDVLDTKEFTAGIGDIGRAAQYLFEDIDASIKKIAAETENTLTGRLRSLTMPPDQLEKYNIEAEYLKTLAQISQMTADTGQDFSHLVDLATQVRDAELGAAAARTEAAAAQKRAAEIQEETARRASIRKLYDQVMVDYEDTNDFQKKLRSIDTETNDTIQRFRDMGVRLFDSICGHMTEAQQVLRSKIDAIHDREIDALRTSILDSQQKLVDMWAGVSDDIEQQIFGIKTSMANPQDVQEQMDIVQNKIQTMTGGNAAQYISGFETPEEKIGAINELRELFGKYLEMSEQIYQRPSLEYQSIYANVLQNLEGLKGIATGYQSQEQLLFDQLSILTNIRDLIAGASSYQEGTSYVPKTGLYQLHQGEQVIPVHQRNYDSPEVKNDISFVLTISESRTPEATGSVVKKELENFMKSGIGRKLIQNTARGM